MSRRSAIRWRGCLRWRVGSRIQRGGVDVPALEMTKWFDTNYHYIVPELELEQAFQLDATKILLYTKGPE
jgi:hypothetical protein